MISTLAPNNTRLIPMYLQEELETVDVWTGIRPELFYSIQIHGQMHRNIYINYIIVKFTNIEQGCFQNVVHGSIDVKWS